MLLSFFVKFWEAVEATNMQDEPMSLSQALEEVFNYKSEELVETPEGFVNSYIL